MAWRWSRLAIKLLDNVTANPNIRKAIHKRALEIARQDPVAGGVSTKHVKQAANELCNK
jgi:hypothetical protein